MDINIVGGGPGGLFLSYLVKRRFPEWTVRVYEQNDASATYGWVWCFRMSRCRF